MADAGDAPRDGLDVRDVLGPLDDPAQEHRAVLGVDVDAAFRDAGAAEELCLDVVRERDVVGRQLGGVPGVQRAPEDADGSRFRPPGAAHGLDVDESGEGKVSDPRMYQLIRQSGPIADRLFEIEFLGPGAAVFDFTFG